MAQVNWSRRALADLASISHYIAQSNPFAASDITARLLAAGNSLASFPNRGRPARLATRELVSVRPYIVVYEVIEREVFILRIRHSAQLSEV